MISIIICSVKKNELEKVSESIRETIGEAFEIISIDNTESKYGICHAYNQGALAAKGDIFCFMHEDISFETKNWGLIVRKHLNDPGVGIIGVAGGSSKSMVPWSWSPVIHDSEINIIQHYKYAAKGHAYIHKSNYPENKLSIRKVVSLDGVWMCARRDVFRQFQFDADSFQGFHGYDIDFSLQVSTKFAVCVVFDVLIHHYSEGSFNKQWMQSAIKVSNKWSSCLPASVTPLSKENLIIQHWTCMKLFIKKLIDLKYKRLIILKYVLKFSRNRLFSHAHFLSSIKLIVLK